MIGPWKMEICSSKPESLQFISKDRYIERKNIVEKTGIANNEEYIYWECESREIDSSDYNLLQSITNIEVDKAIDEYTLQLIEEGLL